MVIGTCWYLSGVLLLASLCASAVTVVPGHESAQEWLIAGTLTASFLFAATAVFLHRRQWPWIRESKLAKNLFLGLAALATRIVFLSTVG
jgi:hypothetical protein